MQATCQPVASRLLAGCMGGVLLSPSYSLGILLVFSWCSSCGLGRYPLRRYGASAGGVRELDGMGLVGIQIKSPEAQRGRDKAGRGGILEAERLQTDARRRHTG